MVYLTRERQVGQMKILIAYASKTGTTETCAVELASCFDMHKVSLCDLAKEEPKIGEFDFVVVGGSIRMGKLDGRVTSFLRKNEDELASVGSAYFICNAFHEESEKYLKKNIPEKLLSSAVAAVSFGGEVRKNKQKGLSRIIVDMILTANDDNKDFIMPTVSGEAIGRFADRIKASRN